MGKLSKKAKIIWGIIISVIIVLLLSFCLIQVNSDFSYTKNYSEPLSSIKVQFFIGKDIKAVKPIVEDFITKYNQKDSKYIQAEMFAQEIMNGVHKMFGKNISYDLAKAKITVNKKNKNEKDMLWIIPADFEKHKNAYLELYFKSDKNKNYVFNGYSFNQNNRDK